MRGAVLTLALRYLRSRRVAVVAVLTIAIGVMAMIVVTSLMDGVQAFIKDHIKGTQADITVTWARVLPGVRLWDYARGRLAGEMAATGGPIQALSPRLRTEALIAPGEHPGPEDEDRIRGIRLVGITFRLERDVTPLGIMMERVGDAALRVSPEDRDHPLAGGDLPAILLGDSLARELGVGRGGGPGLHDAVTVAVGDVDPSDLGNTKARRQVFRVAGCYSANREDYDRLIAYVDREALWRLRGGGRKTTSVHLRLLPGTDLAATTRRLAEESPDLCFRSWERANRNELKAIKDQKRIMVVILFFIVAVAAVAILGIVYLMVKEKQRDIGILRSMGLGRRRLVMVFTLYGLILGVVGSLAGLVLGLYVTAHLDEVVSWLSGVTGVDLFNAEIYRFKTIPTRTQPGAVLAILLTAQALSLLAALLPASLAGGLTPVEALRSE